MSQISIVVSIARQFLALQRYEEANEGTSWNNAAHGHEDGRTRRFDYLHCPGDPGDAELNRTLCGVLLVLLSRSMSGYPFVWLHATSMGVYAKTKVRLIQAVALRLLYWRLYEQRCGWTIRSSPDICHDGSFYSKSDDMVWVSSPPDK